MWRCAKNGVQRQMMADMFGCDVKTVTATEGPALGVAILAGVGAGIYDSVEAACRKMIHTDPEKECHPDAAAIQGVRQVPSALQEAV